MRERKMLWNDVEEKKIEKRGGEEEDTKDKR